MLAAPRGGAAPRRGPSPDEPGPGSLTATPGTCPSETGHPPARTRHNVRDFDTLDQMAALVKGMEGKRLMYSDLTAGEQVCGPPPGTFIRYA